MVSLVERNVRDSVVAITKGMNDLLAPILVALDGDEVESFW
jgi:hypothetical protein